MKVLPEASSTPARKELLFRKATHFSALRSQPSEVPPIVHDVLRSSGQPLDAGTRAFMEPRFGHDFSRVRVHTNATANRSARAIGAKAYTSGSEIVFGPEQYMPTTRSGRTLLAHELVHVLQQQGSPSQSQQTLIPNSDPTEAEAGAISEAVVEGRVLSPIQTGTTKSPQSISAQLDPQQVYCALHAAVCLGLSENPPAAALCWMRFAEKCSGAMASQGEAPSDGALAGVPPTNKTLDEQSQKTV
jgi:hypothetical protein